MKITPTDIRYKKFPKKGMGLEKEEVYAFLAVISESMDELLRENACMKETIAMLDTQLKEYKDLDVAAWNFVEHCIRFKTKGNKSEG